MSLAALIQGMATIHKSGLAVKFLENSQMVSKASLSTLLPPILGINNSKSIEEFLARKTVIQLIAQGLRYICHISATQATAQQ